MIQDEATPDTASDDRPWRPAAGGASFVYFLPCPGMDDIAKLGMSRDPLERCQALHPRWYEFFDLERGWLLETDRVRDARAIELGIGRELREHRAPAPLTVNTRAGGDTEWYRGASDWLEARGESFSRAGHRLHRPLLAWLRPRLLERAHRLYHWSDALMDAIGQAAPADATRLQWTLRNGLDAYAALDLPLDPWIPARALRWHQAAGH